MIKDQYIFKSIFETIIIYLLLGFDEVRFELDTACDLPGLLKPPGFSPPKTF